MPPGELGAILSLQRPQQSAPQRDKISAPFWCEPDQHGALPITLSGSLHKIRGLQGSLTHEGQ